VNVEKNILSVLLTQKTCDEYLYQEPFIYIIYIPLYLTLNIFPDSFNFNPLNFLNRNYKQESFIPFSLGKRACAVIILVKMELFLFFTCLIKKFKIVKMSN